MNQEEIGKFIAECRKNKKITQQELANKLNVTDKAVSKWENGRCMPDLSLMNELCEILGISINELLSGKRLTNEEYQKKLEENIIKINLTFLKKYIVKTLKIFLITILSIITFIIIIITARHTINIVSNKHIELDKDKVSFNICKYKNYIMIEPLYNDLMYVGYNISENYEKGTATITSVYRELKYYINPKLIKKDNVGTSRTIFNKTPKKIYYKDKLIWDSNIELNNCS